MGLFSYDFIFNRYSNTGPCENLKDLFSAYRNYYDSTGSPSKGIFKKLENDLVTLQS